MSGDTTAARKYLLGLASESERDAIESGYVASATALEAMEEAEESLIEDYLDARLAPEERRHFERSYLASPAHRQRVAVVRSLRAAANRQARPTPSLFRSARYLALAATLAIVVVGGVLASRQWLATAPEPVRRPAVSDGSQAANATPSREVAVALRPVQVRGDTDAMPLVIPPGTTTVVIDLESTTVPGGEVRIRTAAGDEVWRGMTDRAGSGGPRAIVPAALLKPDDYIVTLATVDDAGRRTERESYVLHVRQ